MVEPWKTKQEVKRLSISRKEIGRGVQGIVYLGRLWFKGRKPIRVAVKRFKAPIDNHLSGYRKAVAGLRRAGAPVLKTGFIKHEGEWVQVQHLFGSTAQRSKIISPFSDFILGRNKDALLDTIAKIINAGYHPANDAIGLIKTQSGHVPVVYDFDALARGYLRRSLAENMATGIAMWVTELHRATNIPKQQIVSELKKRISHREGKRALKIAEAKL